MDDGGDDAQMDDAEYERLIAKHSDPHFLSSKVRALIERLRHIEQHFACDKVLVFSNFTDFFRIVSKQLSKARITHLQFHGAMSRKKRKSILDEFEASATCKVLLISAKCASVGLNLMCANRVILLDPRCNSRLEQQAIGRVWRLGQKKKVYVERIIMQRTVEETMLSLLRNGDGDAAHEKAKFDESDFDVIFGVESESIRDDSD